MMFRIYANSSEQRAAIPLETYPTERAARTELNDLNRELREGNLAPEIRSFVIRRESTRKEEIATDDNE